MLTTNNNNNNNNGKREQLYQREQRPFKYVRLLRTNQPAPPPKLTGCSDEVVASHTTADRLPRSIRVSNQLLCLSGPTGTACSGPEVNAQARRSYIRRIRS